MTHHDVGDERSGDGAGDDTADTAGAAGGRRALIGAGLIGAALAIAGGRPAAAGSPNRSSPTATGAPTGVEAELLEFAMLLELTIRDLYDASIRSGGLVDVASVMREQHQSAAQAISAFTGLSASGRNDEVYDSLEAAFAVDDDEEVAAAAYDVESIAVATHTELVRLVERADVAAKLASIAAIEARHCAVLADAAGLGDDLDALLDNDAEPLLPEDLT